MSDPTSPGSVAEPGSWRPYDDTSTLGIIDKLCRDSLECSVLDLDSDDDGEVTQAFLALAERLERIQATLRAVHDNATGWHAGEDGKARALNVIAIWSAEALAGRLHPSVETIARETS